MWEPNRQKTTNTHMSHTCPHELYIKVSIDTVSTPFRHCLATAHVSTLAKLRHVALQSVEHTQFVGLAALSGPFWGHDELLRSARRAHASTRGHGHSVFRWVAIVEIAKWAWGCGLLDAFSCEDLIISRKIDSSKVVLRDSISCSRYALPSVLQNFQQSAAHTIQFLMTVEVIMCWASRQFERLNTTSTSENPRVLPGMQTHCDVHQSLPCNQLQHSGAPEHAGRVTSDLLLCYDDASMRMSFSPNPPSRDPTKHSTLSDRDALVFSSSASAKSRKALACNSTCSNSSWQNMPLGCVLKGETSLKNPGRRTTDQWVDVDSISI